MREILGRVRLVIGLSLFRGKKEKEMEQEEKYEEFIDKYNRIIKENDVHKIKKPENYEELKYTSEEKQNYMIAMLKIYGIFSDEMYKLYTEISKLFFK